MRHWIFQIDLARGVRVKEFIVEVAENSLSKRITFCLREVAILFSESNTGGNED